MYVHRRFYSVGMVQTMQEWYDNCLVCISKRISRGGDRAPLQPIEANGPLELVAVDHLKVDLNQSGAFYFLDHYTTFLVIMPPQGDHSQGNHRSLLQLLCPDLWVTHQNVQGLW